MFDALSCQGRQERPGQAAAAEPLPDEQVFQIDTGGAVPGGEVPEPHRDRSRFVVNLREMTGRGWFGAEKRCGDLAFGHGALFNRIFECGKFVDHCDDRRLVTGSRRPDTCGH